MIAALKSLICLFDKSQQSVSSVLSYPSLLWNACKNSILNNILYHIPQIIIIKKIMALIRHFNKMISNQEIIWV